MLQARSLLKRPHARLRLELSLERVHYQVVVFLVVPLRDEDRVLRSHV